jgi:hypothetical protein
MLQFNTISLAGASIQSLKENKIKSGCPRSAEINFVPDQIRSSTVGGDQIWLLLLLPNKSGRSEMAEIESCRPWTAENNNNMRSEEGLKSQIVENISDLHLEQSINIRLIQMGVT